MRKYPRYFEDLKERLGTDLCTKCCACKAVCDTIHPDREILTMKNGEPELIDKVLCSGCGVCIDVCPQAKTDLEFNNLFKDSMNNDYGYLIEDPVIIGARNLSFPVQDGGIVSTLVINAIKKNYVDAAVLTGRDEKWVPITEIVTNPNEVSKFAGSKYTTSRPMPTLLKALNSYKNVLFIGLPHQVRAARRIQQYNKLDLGGKNLKAIIGLFCMESFNYDRLFNKIKVNPAEIEKMELNNSVFSLIKKDNIITQKSLQEIRSCANYYCSVCNDFISELSDISVGSVTAFKDKNIVFIRNKIGRELIELSKVSIK